MAWLSRCIAVLMAAAVVYGAVRFLKQDDLEPLSVANDTVSSDTQPGADSPIPAVSDVSPAAIPAGDELDATGSHVVPFPELDPAVKEQASWINPLQSRLWLRDGWVLNESSMSAEQPAALATFLRPYRGLMVEFTVDHPEVLTEPVDGDENATETGPAFLILRLVTRDNRVQTSLELTRYEASLRFHDNDAQQLVKTVTTDTDLMHSRLWLTATPSRLMLRSDDHLLINAPRRGGAGELYFQLEACDPGLTVTDLRFEGE